MSAPNPYDRRKSPHTGAGDAVTSGAIASGGWNLDSVSRLHFSAPRALTIDEIDAVAHAAFLRGQSSTREAHRAEVAHVQRRAWDRGHNDGMSDGRIEILKRIDDLHGEAANELRNRLRELIAEFNSDPRRVPKARLVEALADSLAVVHQLIENHHHEFVEIPF